MTQSRLDKIIDTCNVPMSTIGWTTRNFLVNFLVLTTSDCIMWYKLTEDANRVTNLNGQLVLSKVNYQKIVEITIIPASLSCTDVIAEMQRDFRTAKRQSSFDCLRKAFCSVVYWLHGFRMWQMPNPFTQHCLPSTFIQRLICIPIGYV